MSSAAGADEESVVVHDLELLPERLEGKHLERFLPGVEVLVKPHVRRRKHAERTPIIAFHWGAFEPHERITFPLEHENVSAEAVAVRLLVGPYGRFGNVRRDDVVAEFQLDVGGARTLSCPIMELELLDIGDKTRIPDPPFSDSAVPLPLK